MLMVNLPHVGVYGVQMEYNNNFHKKKKVQDSGHSLMTMTRNAFGYLGLRPIIIVVVHHV